MKKLFFTLILGVPLLIISSPECYALFIKDPRTGMVKPNPQLKIPCNCPCTTKRLSNTTCLECRHRVGKSMTTFKDTPAVDLVLTRTR